MGEKKSGGIHKKHTDWWLVSLSDVTVSGLMLILETGDYQPISDHTVFLR